MSVSGQIAWGRSYIVGRYGTQISGAPGWYEEGPEGMTEPAPPPPSRSPDAADLALAKVATPWVSRVRRMGHTGRNEQLAQALAAWLQARGIY